MIDHTEEKQKANGFRKSGDFNAALQIYRNLWPSTGDKFDGTGLLHCLRKLKLFDEAIRLCDEIGSRFLDFNWFRTEVIWTYLEGVLLKYDDTEPINNVLKIANRIMGLGPEQLPAKLVTFKVMKHAKQSNSWNIISEWVEKVDPNTLSLEPIIIQEGKKGWCDRAIWYNYRINSFLKENKPQMAIDSVDEIVDLFPIQKKFFVRLKALAFHQMGNLTDSERLYADLCRVPKPDWWLLHDYSNVIKDAGRKEEALKLMCKAASSHFKLEALVTLFYDMGTILKELGKNEAAGLHLMLCKKIREEHTWGIPPTLGESLKELNESIINDINSLSPRELHNKCRKEWDKILGSDSGSHMVSSLKPTKNLNGKVLLYQDERPFCFIECNESESIFCYKSDLPCSIINGDIVTFDTIPSFDKRKNRESLKATNIRIGSNVRYLK